MRNLHASTYGTGSQPRCSSTRIFSPSSASSRFQVDGVNASWYMQKSPCVASMRGMLITAPTVCTIMFGLCSAASATLLRYTNGVPSRSSTSRAAGSALCG